MMKVYQPVCPDMKFRLTADLSPDGVEVSEDSTVSSDSASCMSDDEDIPGTVPVESPASDSHPTHYASNRFPPSPASAPSVPTVGTAEVCQQHQPSTPATNCLMSELSSASAHVGGAGCVDNCPGWIRHQSQTVSSSISECTPQGACRAPSSRPDHGEEEEDCSVHTHVSNFPAVDSGAACCIQQPPVGAYDKLLHSIKPRTQDVPQINKNDHCVCDDEDSEDDNESIEDISISHNVPMCPPSPAPFSPARTPPMTPRKMVVAVDREVGSVSNASSQSPRPEPRSSALYLDVHTNKCPSPYTLACAITPSPLHEHTTMASTLSSASSAPSAEPQADHGQSHTASDPSADQVRETQPSRQRHSTGGSQAGPGSPTSAMNRSIYDEIQEALIKEVSGEDLDAAPLTSDIDPAQQYPFIHKHMGHLFDKKRLLIGYTSATPVRHRDVSTSPCRSGYSSVRSRHLSAASTASEAATSMDDNVYMNKIEDGDEEVITVTLDDDADGAASATVIYSQQRRRKNSDGDGSRRHSSSTMATPYSDLEVTHRGMHRFIPRHADEVQVGIGDPIHVIKEFDDLWCEGVNLRSGERGIFPAMYANDLTFLEESEEEDEHWKFTMRFLGTVEVTSASGDIALCQAINKVAQQGRIKAASLCILEINQYGIRMIDKSKEGHESHKFSNFFALKNISFCGTHPNNNRLRTSNRQGGIDISQSWGSPPEETLHCWYFAFITKHPREARFACHVFHSERSTHRARDALGKAFKRFYQEYMAFTHPTEDIWME